jgi:hypothetical protein
MADSMASELSATLLTPTGRVAVGVMLWGQLGVTPGPGTL